MTATSPSAFFLSATLHAVVVALVLLFAYATGPGDQPKPKVLELVAGEGDNYMATEAPALGVPGGVQLNLPKAPEPKPAPPEPTPPAPPPPEPTPPAPTPPVPAPTPKPTPAPVTKADSDIPNFKNDVRRKIIVADSKAKREIAKERAAEKKRLDEEKKRMTKEEFDRANKAKTTASAKTGSTKVAKVDAEGIAKGVVGGSTRNKTGGAGGKALTSENTDVLAAYDRLFKDRLRHEFQPPPGLGDSLKVDIEVRSAADGTLSGARVVRSSGSREFDQAVLEAVRRVRMPARPDKKSEVVEFTFTMKEKNEG